MTSKKQLSLYRRITDLETIVEKLEGKLRESIKQKHEPVAYLGRTATAITAKASGVLGSGEINIYEVQTNKAELDTAQKFRCLNFASGTDGGVAINKDVVVLRVGRSQVFVVIWVLC